MSGGLFWYPSVKTIATLRGSVDGCSCCWPRFSPPPIEVRLRGVSVFAPVLMAVCCVVSKAARGVRTAKASSNCTEPISKPVEGITRSANIPTADCSAVIRVPPDTAVAILPERSNTSSMAAGETGTPLPVSGTEMLGFAGSLLVIVNVPLAVPAAAGANTTVKLCDVPGATAALSGTLFTGTVVGLPVVRTKSAPATVSVALSISHGPVFETFTAMPMKYCSGTAPKLMEVGETAMAGGGSGVPVPLSATLAVGCVGSSDLKVSVPLAGPVAPGEKLTWTLPDPPAGTVSDAPELSLNPAPDVAIWVRSRSTGPVLPTVASSTCERQTATLPKPSGPGSHQCAATRRCR